MKFLAMFLFPFFGFSQNNDLNLKTIDVDTVIYKEIKCGLFISNNGDVAYKSKLINRYISWIYDADTMDIENGGLVEMKYIVDTLSFKFLNDIYWVDNFRVYGFNPMSDGGTIFFNKYADPKTFKALADSFYGKDKNHVFYKGAIIKAADVKSFKVVKNVMLPDLAKDKKCYYVSGIPVSKIRLKELKK